ncbi:acyltransferase family protein [Enterococcus florum]|uniref:acyltransferase family protein n=1 Tax=Enterococcus florum TaxID=2480627 RepID=UPI0011BA7FB2|nr:acyltransferase [Enterococcus florum]
MEKQYSINYSMLNVMKFAAALLVICVHCGTMLGHPLANFFIQNILCRLAVPFFFISGAYFIRKKTIDQPNYFKQKLFSMGKNYLLWSFLFIPIGLDWLHQNLQISQAMYPFALLFGLGYIGTYYHLWYIPALMLSLVLVDHLLKRLSYKAVFLIAGLFYLFGSFETYYELITVSAFRQFFDQFIQLFFTTRNGLFYGLIFTTVGFYIFDHQHELFLKRELFKRWLFPVGLFLILEGLFAFQLNRLDCNFLIILVPFSFLLFLTGATSRYHFSFPTDKLRRCSQYYYFIHPIVIIILYEIGNGFHLPVLRSGPFSFLLAWLFTHFLSCCLIQIKRTPIRKRVWIGSFFFAFLWTEILGAFIYLKGHAITPVQFEIIPCILMASLVFFVSLLSKRKRSVSMF